MIPFLTALAVVFIVATAGSPSFMAWVPASRAFGRAESALSCFVGWLVLLFLTVFVCLMLNSEQAGSFVDGSALGTLLNVSYVAGPALAVVSFVAMLVYRHEKAAKS